MNIKINAAELAQILEATPCEQNIMPVGKHGNLYSIARIRPDKITGGHICNRIMKYT